MLGQGQDILGPLPQGRNVHGNDVESVIEIPAEGALGHLFFQIPVGGGHDAGVHRQGSGAADAVEPAVLEHGQQLHLELGRQFADFVQKDHAVSRQLKDSPLSRPVGPGKGAGLIAEQL